MDQPMEQERAAGRLARAFGRRPDPVSHIAGVYVVFTSVDGTLAALRVASEIARALAASVTLVDFRGPARSPGEDVSPVQTNAFAGRLRAAGLTVQTRVYRCHDPQRAFAVALRRGSLVVIGDRGRSWWPTRPERLQRALAHQGYFVLFVDEASHPEDLGRNPAGDSAARRERPGDHGHPVG
jgi:hypothetical protein